jgi:hypothetical protein
LGAAAAPSPLQPAPRTQKPASNVYTMMLILAFIAICVGCTVLYMHLSTYGSYPWWKVDPSITAPSAP